MASVRPEARSRTSALRAKVLREAQPNDANHLNLLAHDLRTPLAAISMNLDFALSELPDQEYGPVRAALQDCKEANARAVRLVSDMANALRLSSGDHEPSLRDVSASKVVASVVASASAGAATRGVRIGWTSSDDLVRADADLLECALDRVVQEAVRHANGSCHVDQRGGTFVIRAGTVAESLDSARSSLSIVFAEAAIRAQRGRFAAETVAGELVYRVTLPTADRAR
ncbi:MAG TPA: histidine kinase dimerization/phospho-acceptor domain-containing protein [Polyangiaceae bacterium]|nr:histidine kinase dimerization/phospho-acceptor domain-containing protein [Polyangiaceae bacterium]